MKFALPKFQFRFIPSMGNVIHPGNFHPVGTRRAAAQAVERALAAAGESRPTPGAGGSWLIVGGSGGFGSAARIALGVHHGAHTLNLSLDASPNPESRNKMRTVGSPGWHRSRELEHRLRDLDLVAETVNGDAFNPETLARVIRAIREQLPGGVVHGIVWSLAAPRGLDPRTGKLVGSALKPIGGPVSVKTFSGRGRKGDEEPRVVEFTMPPGTPEEAVNTQYVMGGRIVEQWVTGLLDAGVLATGARLLTLSYRGNPLNEGIYRKGLIGLAKADLEFHTRALDAVLKDKLGGRALAVEGPAVVTEASGGIPGVPFYMALLLDVMGAQHEDPLASMTRMFAEKLPAGGEPVVDEEGLVRMDDRELAEAVQAELARRHAAATTDAPFDGALFDRFMTEYARTRGFDIEGVDYSAELDSDVVCDLSYRT